jgi:hypothetical protein
MPPPLEKMPLAPHCLDGRQPDADVGGMTASDDDKPPGGGRKRPLTPAAQRALAEAAERRAEIDRRTAERTKEIGGREGPEPTRYGDWENKGMASDF